MNEFKPNQPVVSSAGMNHGAVAIEQSRAITEAQGKLMLAKQFPRDENEAFTKVMESCKRAGMANQAVYSFPRGRQTVSGPSIRLVEEIARCYGNIEYGLRELSNAGGESEMEAYAWDLQTNTVSSQKFKVKHIRDKRGGGEVLKDQRDIYEITANMGARRLRARMLAILPPDIVESAVDECRKTMSGQNEKPRTDRIRDLLQAFDKLSVTKEMIENRLEHGVDAISEDEIVDLRGIYNSIKNSQSKRDEWFTVKTEVPVIEAKGDFNPVTQAKPDPIPQAAAPEQQQAPTDDVFGE